MTKTLASIVSVLLHPMLMPTYGLLIIFHTNNSLFLLPFEAKRIIFIIVAINTLALPLLMIPLFHRLTIIKSIQMHSHRERIIPLAFTIIPYIFSYFFLQKLPIVSEVSLFMLGASIAIAITLAITIWWKISIHMVGIGGVTGLLFALSQKLYVDINWYLMGVIILAGIVAWARLALHSHKPSQVYMGFVLGSVTVALSILLV
jgi:hypothetical protein